MMRRSFTGLLLSALMVCFLVPSAWAQSFDDLIIEGLAAYKSGDYDKAIESFLKARIQQDEPDLTYNIARSYHKKGSCIPAVENYKDFLNHPDTQKDNANISKAQGYIEELGECPTQGTLSMTCTPDGIKIKIGTQEYGSCADIPLEQGDYVVVAIAEGYTPQDFRVTIKPEQVEPLVVVLTKIPDVLPIEPDGPNYLAWSLVGAGGLLIVGAIATDLVNLFVNEEELKKISATDPDRKSFEDSYRLNQVLILSLGGVGLAAAITGSILLILDAVEEKPEGQVKTEDDSNLTWSLSPSVSPDGDVGAVFQLKF